MRKAIVALLASVLVAQSLHALEARDVKRATDKAGNWIIEQYDVKEKVFKGEGGTDVKTVALIVRALCNSPRDYKEANGPYISEPVKFLKSRVKGDGTLKGEAGDAQLVCLALKSTKNEKYQELTEKMEQAPRKLPSYSTWTSVNEVTTIKLESGALFTKLAQAELHSKEVELDGKKVKWAEPLAEALMKLQQKNGSFGEDLQVNALALELLNVCYKALK